MFLVSFWVGGLSGSFIASEEVSERTDVALEPLSFAESKATSDWVRGGLVQGTLGGAPVVNDAMTDSNGNTFIAGWLLGDVTFGSIAITGAGQEAFVGKIDSSGNWQMIKSAPGFAGGGYSSANGMALDSMGNIYLTGYYSGNVSFGNYQLVSTADSNGDETLDAFVAKMGPTGNWLWAASGGGPYDSDMGNGVISDGSGGAFVTGALNTTGQFGMKSSGTNGAIDVFVGHVDGNGTWQWVENAGGPSNDDGQSIAIGSAGLLRVSGGFQGGGTQGAQFGSQTFNAIGSSDIFVSKMTTTGGWLWTETAGAPGQVMVGWGFDVEGENSFVGGLYGGTASFGSHSVTAAASSNAGFIAKMDAAGTWQWASSTNGTGVQYIGGLDVDTGGIAFSGGFSSGQTSSATFGTTSLTGTYFEMVAGVMDASGNWLWAKNGGSAGDDGYYNWGTGGVGWLPSGDIVSVGHICQGMQSSCTATFGSDTLTVTPGQYNTYYGLPPAVAVWKQASDADGDGISDSQDNCPFVANAGQEDIDSDSIGNVCDSDADNDGLANDVDDCDGPAVNWNASYWPDDIDMDGCRDIDEDDDDDQDGASDSIDPCTGPNFKLNWTSNVVNDNDADGCHDIEEDDDDDNDGIDDTAGDACPRDYSNWGIPDGSGGFNHNISADYDEDGCHDDEEDADDDNDGIDDFDAQGTPFDRCQKGKLDWTSDATLDHDGDGCRDSDEDWDDDNDGVDDVDTMMNVLDLCSPGAVGWNSDPTTDRDGDGCRDLDEDDDDDGDGIDDTVDDCFVQVGWTSNALTDHDGDGCRDMDEDDNDDNDPVYDASDECATGEVGWVDTDWDGDGCRDETEDTDDDNDGICDDAAASTGICSAGPDICPETPDGEPINADGCGTFTQVDTDGDGIFDGMDLCDEIAAADGYDDDLDGCTDDTDGDTVTDDIDPFPEDSTQWADRDGDGRGDNPGQLNSDDCPDTPSQWVWNVPNGTLGCAWEELDDDDDGVLNGYDDCPQTEAGKAVDGNGCSQWQIDDDSDGVVNADDNCDETGESDTLIDEIGCSHEQRLAAGDVDAMLKEYGMILGIVGGALLLSIVAMIAMLSRRKKGKGGMDAWDADSAQLATGGYVAGQPATPLSAQAPAAGPTRAASYAELPANGNYVTDAAGGTWYNAPDGSQWAMQGDGSFIKN